MKHTYKSGERKQKKREERHKITSKHKHSLDTFLIHKDGHNTPTGNHETSSNIKKAMLADSKSPAGW